MNMPRAAKNVSVLFLTALIVASTATISLAHADGDQATANVMVQLRTPGGQPLTQTANLKFYLSADGPKQSILNVTSSSSKVLVSLPVPKVPIKGTKDVYAAVNYILVVWSGTSAAYGFSIDPVSLKVESEAANTLDVDMVSLEADAPSSIGREALLYTPPQTGVEYPLQWTTMVDVYCRTGVVESFTALAGSKVGVILKSRFWSSATGQWTEWGTGGETKATFDRQIHELY